MSAIIGGKNQMFAIHFNLPLKALQEFEKEVEDMQFDFEGRLATVFNRTARETVKRSVEEVHAIVNLKTTVIKNGPKSSRRKKNIFQSKKARRTDHHAQARIADVGKLSLHHFSPIHNKAGTSYKIMRGGPRKLIKGAFMGPRPKVKAAKLFGGVYIREVYPKGKRLPIRKAGMGPSPWGVVQRHALEPKIRRHAEQEMLFAITSVVDDMTNKYFGV